MTSSYITSQFGLKFPKRYTVSFGRFALDASDNLLLLGYIQISDKFKAMSIEEVKKLASDPDNPELNNVNEELLFSVSNKISNAATYERILSQMTFCRFIDNFLCYLKEIIAEVAQVNPSVLLPGKPSITDTAITDKTLDEQDLKKIDKELNKLFYKDFQTIVTFFKDRLAINILEKDLKTLTIFAKERNIIVHNRATVSDELIELQPELHSKKGMHMQFKYEQLGDILIFLNEIAIEIDKLLAEKYGLILLGNKDI